MQAFIIAHKGVTRTKRLTSFFSLLLICALLIKNADALAAAQNGLRLVGAAVIPALFPFFVAIGLLEARGVFSSVAEALSGLSKALRLPKLFLPCFLLGAVSGYPSGARLCGGAGMDRYACLCNLCSPIFIVGVVSTGLMGSAEAALPILIGHYGAALIGAIVYFACAPQQADAAGKSGAAAEWRPSAPPPLAEVLSEAAVAMLRIGGCIVFFLVVSALLGSFGILSLLAAPFARLGVAGEAAEAILLGLLEFTGGCQALSALALSLRAKAALSALLISFGGLSVFLQARMFAKLERPLSYLAVKAAQALLAGGLCYLFFPLCIDPGAEAVAISGQKLANNAITGLSLLTASSATLAGVYLAAKISSGLRRNARARRYRQ